MDAAARRALVELVGRYGPGLAEDPRRLEGLLRDHCGAHRREIAVLVAAAREGAPRALLDPRASAPVGLRVKRLAQRLEDELALDPAAAVWAVETWAAALGLAIGAQARAPSTPRPPTPEAPPMDAAPSPPPRQAPREERVAALPKYDFAHLGRRFGAFLLDDLILYVLNAFVGGVLAASNASVDVFGAATVLLSVLDFAYFIGFWSTNGQTLGMRALKIKVVRQDGAHLTVGTGFVRCLGYLIGSWCVGLGLLWALWDPKRQAWHDKMAKTLVVRAA